MVFTAAQRAAIAANDPAWQLQLRVRVLFSLFLLIPLGCLGYVASYSSNFESPAYQLDSKVWPLLLLTVLSLIWNLTTLAIYTKWKRPLNPLIQLLIHGILTLLYIIVGAVATHDAALASSIIDNDPYDPAPGSGEMDSTHTIKADNGSIISVTPGDTDSCPAFLDCAAQQVWMDGVKHRSSIAIAGCAFFFLCLPVHLFLTVIFLRDYRIRRMNEKESMTDDFQLKRTPPVSQSFKQPYGVDVEGGETASQVNLLRDGRGGLGFHKPGSVNDSVISVETPHKRPSTAKTTRSRSRFLRRKSDGPSLPLALSLSRASSKASTIASRRQKSNASTIASRRKKSADPNELMPPMPPINTSNLRVSAISYMPQTPDTAILSPRSEDSRPSSARDAEFPSTSLDGSEEPPRERRRKPPPAPLRKPPPPKLSPFPHDPNPRSPLSPTILISTATTQGPDSPARTVKTNTTGPRSPTEQERPMSPIIDPFSLSPHDEHDPGLSALPIIPLDGLPRLSSQSTRPTTPLSSLGDMDVLRSIRSTLFAGDASSPRRSSFGSASNGRTSPFPRSHSPISFGSALSGRTSPWKERQERKELQKELEKERQERQRELMDAEQKAHRAAEKMESTYLRNEIGRQDDKAAMRQKKIEDRIAKLKDTLEELKKTQDEEERRAEERAERERLEEQEFEAELAKYGDVMAARVVHHVKSDSIKSIDIRKGSGETARTKRSEAIQHAVNRSLDKELPPPPPGIVQVQQHHRPTQSGSSLARQFPMPPPVPESEPAKAPTGEDRRPRYSWETGYTLEQQANEENSR